MNNHQISCFLQLLNAIQEDNKKKVSNKEKLFNQVQTAKAGLLKISNK